MGTSLHLLPAAAANANRKELGEWLETIGIGAAVLGRVHIEAACEDQDTHAINVANWLADDLATIVAALGKCIACGKLTLIEELFGVDTFNRLSNMARALGSPLAGNSFYYDFTVEGIRERDVRGIGKLDRNAVERDAEARA